MIYGGFHRKCEWCGGPIALNKKKKVRFCGRRCSDMSMRARTTTLTQPMDDEEERLFDAEINKRKKELHESERAMILSQTPRNDSPAAELKMRKKLGVK